MIDGYDLRRIDARPVGGATDEIRAFLCVKNERDRLPWLFRYHRDLGVHRFLVIDNGSADGTSEYVLDQVDAHLFAAAGSYERSRNGIDWLEALLYTYGQDRWCLLLDADEQFVYPGCETMALAPFCRALSERGAECLPTQFIDMYADAPVLQTHVASDVPPLETCPYFDGTGYCEFPVGNSVFPRLYGGPRARLFWPEVDLVARATGSNSYIVRAFDEQDYLSRHADVAQEVRSGRLKSGLEHFMRYGHRERRKVSVRSVPDWPEDVYLGVHPDVRDTIAKGTLHSGLDHYVRYGYFEGRPAWTSAPPCLTQVPLVYWRDGLSLEVGRHSLIGVSAARQYVVGGALLHFRLVDSIVSKACQALSDGAQNASAWSRENQRYRDVLARTPTLLCMAPVSVRYRDSGQLVDMGLVAPAPVP